MSWTWIQTAYSRLSCNTLDPSRVAGHIPSLLHLQLILQFILSIERFSSGVLGGFSCIPTSCAYVDWPTSLARYGCIRLIRDVDAYPESKRESPKPNTSPNIRCIRRIHIVFDQYTLYSDLYSGPPRVFDLTRPGTCKSGLARPRDAVYCEYKSGAAETL